MLKNSDKRTSLFYKYACFLAIISISIIAYAKISSAGAAFSQAKDFPKGALVYAQFQDLPAVYKIWDESELKQKYLESANFSEFNSSHLALKLLSRLEEFQAANGFDLDVSAILSSSETKAAIAVYDIGRLEFVFVAPLSEEKMLASRFLLNKSAFEETTLEDGTVFYSKNVAADRGRQKQKILFANAGGRFVLATDEVKFFKTLALINGKSKDKNLYDFPAFKNLSEKIEPHSATVWVDQRRLNDDWYFKHYWAFKNTEKLKKIRAGIFDFEVGENKLLEHRKFLLNSSFGENKRKISQSERENLHRFVPENAAYFAIRSIQNSEKSVGKEIYQTLFDGFSNSEKNVENHDSHEQFYFEDYGENYRNYGYLDDKYEAEINEDDGGFEIEKGDSQAKNDLIENLQNVIQKAEPEISLTIISPQSLPMPLFFECRRGLVLSLGNADKFDRQNFETAIAALANEQLAVSGGAANLTWKTVKDGGKTRRELDLPILGWKLFYALKNNQIIFANNAELLDSMLNENPFQDEFSTKIEVEKVITLQLNRHETAFDEVMNKIKEAETKSEESASFDFFTDNVGSLFEVLSNVKRVEIKTSSAASYLTEELTFILD